MTNLLNDPIYITVQELKDSSPLINDTTPNPESLITQAQYAIDGYIGSYGLPEEDGQPFIFPTTEWMPDDIKVATVMVCDFLYMSGQSLATMQWLKVKSESNMSRSVVFESAKVNKNDLISQIPVNAMSILRKYKNNFISQVI